MCKNKLQRMAGRTFTKLALEKRFQITKLENVNFNKFKRLIKSDIIKKENVEENKFKLH